MKGYLNWRKQSNPWVFLFVSLTHVLSVDRRRLDETSRKRTHNSPLKIIVLERKNSVESERLFEKILEKLYECGLYKG